MSNIDFDLRDELTEWQHRYFRGFYSPGYYAFKHEWSGVIATFKKDERARWWRCKWRVYITFLGRGW